MTLTIPPVPAADLAVGDRIAPGLIPGRMHSGDVLFVHTYEIRSRSWTFVAYRIVDGAQVGDIESTHFMADALIRRDAAADTGLGFSREPESTVATPVPEHVEGHAEGRAAVPPPGVVAVADGHVVHECCGKLDDAPHRNFCAEYVPGLIVGDTAVDESRPASGLTPAADQSRGKLAGTTPVVTYFSFGHGQTDPRDGKRLLDHYVTIVAPTYEACREAMLASRFGRAWSFDYLAGTARATERMPRWTEHEVIVAPGTDKALAEVALKAADELLAESESS